MTSKTTTAPAELPTLGTQRPVLRPLAHADAPTVQKLAGARDLECYGIVKSEWPSC